MGKAGRKRKAGPRTASGRLIVLFDKGTDHVQAAKARYGDHYSSAIGRAFVSGLLGADDQAKDRLAMARKLVGHKHTVYGHKGYRCALDTSPRGGNLTLVPDAERDERVIAMAEWLNDADVYMSGCASFVWQLVGEEWVDEGPPWLDRLLARGGDVRDMMVLDAALQGLDRLIPKRSNRMVAVG